MIQEDFRLIVEIMAKFYAVAVGRKRGIYKTRKEFLEQVTGYTSNKCKMFRTLEEAQKFLDDNPAPEDTPAPQDTAAPEDTSENGEAGGEQVIDHGSDEQIADSSNENVPPPAPESELKAWTDGCCYHNGKQNANAGIGVYFGPDHPWNVSEPLDGLKHTNNRAELRAVIRAVKIARDNGYNHITIYTDSEYIINGAEDWIEDWVKNLWLTVEGLPVKNKKDWKEYLQLRRQVDVDFELVKSGEDLNKEADRLAKAGVDHNRIIPPWGERRFSPWFDRSVESYSTDSDRDDYSLNNSESIDSGLPGRPNSTI